ncbi:olfactory receptor 13D1-like [Pelodytes ibericus]
MKCRNDSTGTEFILLGFSTDPTVQVLLFQVFLVVYMAILSGNVLLILAVRCDRRLHNSMYCFLTCLSFLDICYTSITIPQMLVYFLSKKKSISLMGCAVQIYFFLFLGESECVLLAFMAYDRFVAICNPLHYSTVMNIPTCLRMIATAWMTGCIISSIDIFFISQLEFCGPHTINHFFCEAPSLLQLSCNNISVSNVVKLAGSAILLLMPLSFIILSYGQIIAAVMKINSGRYKAFSTCFSHMIVVILFYGAAIFIYMVPKHPGDISDKIMSVFYTIATPFLNPLIYSLRNKDVHKALGLLRKTKGFK